MTGKKEEIHIIKGHTNKPVLDWVSWDFVSYCYIKLARIYGMDKFYRDHGRDCMIIKRIIEKFQSVDRSKIAVLHYIDWAIDKYLKERSNQKNMDISILPVWMEDYLGFRFKDKNNKRKKKRKKVILSEKEKKWIESRQSKKNFVE